MGFFDMFLSEEKKIQKQAARVINRDLQAEDREAAYRWLAENGSGKALVGLLSRFEMRLEHQLNEKDERELVYGLLVQHGAKLERPLRVHLKKARQIAMPLRLYEEVMGFDATIALVYELLDLEIQKDDFHKPEKKTDLLVWLAEHRHDGAIAAASPHLADFDEQVRYAASEVILAQQSDAGRAALEAVLANPQEDSNRLRVRLSEVFAARRWPLDDPDAVGPLLPETHKVVDGRIVANA